MPTLVPMSKQISFLLTDEEYAKIPGKKSPWARAVVSAELAKIRMDSQGNLLIDFAYLIDGKVHRATGINKTAALMSLGYTEQQCWNGIASKHGTVEEAIAQGWLDNIFE